MENVLHLKCIQCGRIYPPDPDRYVCDSDRGLLEVEYDYERATQSFSRRTLDACGDFTMWRYIPLLPVLPGTPRPNLRVGYTPLYFTPRLARELEMDSVYVKDDSQNPTNSSKDRASAIAVVKAHETGARVVACSSTGNAASSLAGQAAAAGLSTCIFVPERAPVGKVAQLMIFGATVIKVSGDYQATFKLSSEVIARHGWYNRNAAINPYLIEGKKTVGMEIAEQMGYQVPDWVVMGVGDGCSIAGLFKGFYEMYRCGLTDRLPRLLGVQASGCAPLARAFHAGTEEVDPEPENTIADSIAVGVPRNPLKALRSVRRSHGTYITVQDAEILEAMRTLGVLAGVFAEPAAAAALAGLKRARKEGIVTRNDRAVVVVTGNGLKDPGKAAQAAGEPVVLPPDLLKFEEAMADHPIMKEEKGRRKEP